MTLYSFEKLPLLFSGEEYEIREIPQRKMSMTESGKFRDREGEDSGIGQPFDVPQRNQPKGMPDFGDSVGSRLGVFPNFFRLTPETPEITEKLWAFAESAYLDNPLPSVFKERLFVHLSRFCAVRYCIARHAGFLLGLGRPAGDVNGRIQSVADVVKLLRRPFPRGEQLQSRLSLCEASHAPLAEMPAPDTEMEDAMFVLAGHVFLKTTDYLACLGVLTRVLGPIRLQYLLLFLAFVRAAHYWTETHPEITFEDDITRLLATHEALSECVFKDPEAHDNVSQLLLDELPALRLEADRANGLLAAIVDSSDDAIVSKTLGGIITSWNASAEVLFGYTAHEAVGQHISLIIPDDRRDEETLIIDKINKGERIDHFDTVRVRKDRTLLDISLTISPVRDASGKIIGASKIARDITRRKAIERELRESEARYRTLADALDTQVQFRTQEVERGSSELRTLSRRLMESQDLERRHIARELHDSAGQTLAALGMSLAELTRNANGNVALAKSVQNADELVQHLTKEIRTTSYLLHPPMLDEAGISSALSWYVQGLGERSDLKVDLKIANNFGRLPSEMELLIFRLVQECLTNIHRHSGSKTAQIEVTREPESVHVTVQDQGAGMTAERLAEIQSHGTGVGIRGMRERVLQFDGHLVIESNASGTRVYASLPLKIKPDSKKQDAA